ncbi:DNA-3-methyladenine glycosylase I [Sediminivirga luteola]|uniref:DNA-3-methyladenine glycosylase I n=1 Tax=Sediminivirga luteola TaxID=1774748 RepID=A0A8J2U065_9MICO|nr:DNA-3-methyladenine glycosylase I [Sediminivirga luteola]MCI2264059.1 DNA-3-methyladenine glycosylase I [Sediminivirga luteola]GGA22685.1 DNA-3-methyladenine glycosylase I [Sediminivirga luteola]
MDAERFAPDDLPRCPWSAGAPELVPYHDTEWGFPVGEDRRLFEKLCLETFQAGLSWRTILNKREAFREVFSGFDHAVIAEFGERDIARLLGDPRIVRNRAKIEATIGNARRMTELVEREGSLAAFVWRYEPAPEELPAPQSVTTSPASIAMAKELKRRGWRFVGPTTAYAFMQAMGLLNDHVHGCVVRPRVDQARAAFTRP